VTAADRLKWFLANALERVCVLEAQLEQTQNELAELRAAAGEKPETEGDGLG
jgi:cell division protein FtsB